MCSFFVNVIGMNLLFCKISSCISHFSLRFHRKYSRSRIVMMPEGPEVQALVNQIQNSFQKYENNLNKWQLADLKILSGRYVKSPLEGYDDLKHLLPLNFIDTKSKGKFIYFNLDKVTIFSTLGLKGHWKVIDGNSGYISNIWNNKLKVKDCIDNNVANVTNVFKFEKRYEIRQYDSVRLAMRFSMISTPVASVSDIPSITTPTTIPTEIILAYYDTIGYGTLKIAFESSQLIQKLDKLGPDWISNPLSLQEFKTLLFKPTTKKRFLAVFLMDQTKTSGIGMLTLISV